MFSRKLLLIILFTYQLFSAEISFKKEIDSYASQIQEQKNQKVSESILIQDIINIINNSNLIDENQKIDSNNYLLKKIGKNHLEKLPPKMKFLLSGPNGLEMYKLFELIKNGLQEKEFINMLLSANGQYTKLGSKAKQLMQEKGFSQKLIDIIDNYNFLMEGKETLIRDLVIMANNGIPTDQISDVIIQSPGFDDIKFTKEHIAFLESMGLQKENLYVLANRKLMLAGPSVYTLYDILKDTKNKFSTDSIKSKIKKYDGYYQSYSDNELKNLNLMGINYEVIKMTEEITNKRPTIRIIQNNIVEKNYASKDSLMEKVHSQSNVFDGINQPNKADKSDGTSLLETVGNCIANKLGKKACEKAPWPLDSACESLVDNKFPCSSF